MKLPQGTVDFSNGSIAITQVDLTNGFTYAYGVVCTVTSTGSNSPSQTNSNSVTPFGRPIITSIKHEPYSGNHTIKANKNGSPITGGIFIGIDSSTNDVPIYSIAAPIGNGTGNRDIANNFDGLS